MAGTLRWRRVRAGCSHRPWRNDGVQVPVPRPLLRRLGCAQTPRWGGVCGRTFQGQRPPLHELMPSPGTGTGASVPVVHPCLTLCPALLDLLSWRNGGAEARPLWRALAQHVGRGTPGHAATGRPQEPPISVAEIRRSLPSPTRRPCPRELGRSGTWDGEAGASARGDGSMRKEGALEPGALLTTARRPSRASSSLRPEFPLHCVASSRSQFEGAPAPQGTMRFCRGVPEVTVVLAGLQPCRAPVASTRISHDRSRAAAKRGRREPLCLVPRAPRWRLLGPPGAGPAGPGVGGDGRVFLWGTSSGLPGYPGHQQVHIGGRSGRSRYCRECLARAGSYGSEAAEPCFLP